jgi:hypothetical protein
LATTTSSAFATFFTGMVILDGNPYRDCYAFNVTLEDFIRHLAKAENITGGSSKDRYTGADTVDCPVNPHMTFVTTGARQTY